MIRWNMLSILVAAIALGGCGDPADTVKPGMPKNEVLDRLGVPQQMGFLYENGRAGIMTYAFDPLATARQPMASNHSRWFFGYHRRDGSEFYITIERNMVTKVTVGAFPIE